VSFVVLDSVSGTDLSGCNCPPKCTNNVHQTTVSSSRLSDMMINYYVKHGKNDSQIGRSYVDAADIRNRVASSSLTDIVGHLEKTIKAYKRLKAMLEVDLIEHTTSVPGQMQASISTIVQKTLDSLAEFSSQIVGKFAASYEQNVDFLVSQIIKTAKSILTSPYLLYLGRRDANDDFVEMMFEHKNTFCKTLEHLGESVYEGRSEANFSAQLFLDRSCHDDLRANKFMRRYCRRSELDTLTSNDTEYEEKLAEFTSVMADTARLMLRCTPMYHMFLTEVDNWLKRALAMNSSQFSQSADRRHVLKELEHELEWLEEVSHIFTEKSAVIAFLYIFHSRNIFIKP